MTKSLPPGTLDTKMLGLIPESVEQEDGECLRARTSSLPNFRSLGPPDLIKVTKATKSKTASCYHFVTGVDTSSSASVAAHLNVLNFVLGESQVWFGRAPQWHLTQGIYCSWNAFSGVDVRVSASFPGGVEASVVDVHNYDMGTEAVADENLWLETYMSAALRAVLLKDSDAYFIEMCRHEDPLATPEDVDRFYRAFEQLYLRGPLLGSDSSVQVATQDANLMINGFLEVVRTTGRTKPAIELLERLSKNHKSALSLLARVLLLADREIEAVELMASTIKEDPCNAQMLAVETEFVLSKKRPDLALDLALRLTAAAPSDYYSWGLLTQVYISRGQYDQALLALNSCPLIPSPHVDQHIRMPTPKRVHSPMPHDGIIDEVWEATAGTKEDQADASLLGLPASKLRGSTARAYKLLADIFGKIGWTELMKVRGEIFLMETEASEAKAEADEDSSTRSVASSGKRPPNRRSIRSKRLCERRIDNLFMVLYEDVRVYSSWQREAVHFESQKLEFKKTALEWELFGAVAQRLHHDEAAKQAFDKSSFIRFSHRVLSRQLDYEAPEPADVRDIQVLGPVENPMATLVIVLKLMAWNHRWYSEFSPRLIRVLRRVVAQEGLTKVHNQLEAAFGRTGAMVLVDAHIKSLQLLEAPGFDS